jgi:hypothetical protein
MHYFTKHRLAAWCALLLLLPGYSVVNAGSYAVVISHRAYTDKAWKAVADALVRKHDGQLIMIEKSPWESGLELVARRPDFVCFVLPPEDAGRDRVANIHRMTRQLNEDPYTDVMWGILTGYDAADALRIAKQKEPLVIRRGYTSMGPGGLENWESGFASSETSLKAFWTKTGGVIEAGTCEPDATQAFVEAFNAAGPDVLYTSGHASERDWMMVYNKPGGQLRSEEGQLIGMNTARQRFALHSPNPKVYLPVGNCLIGHVSGSNCMTTAWLHSGGVCQMFGYTVSTWFGYGGWGVGTYFGKGGQFNLAESFFLNSQALVHQLATRYPQSLKVYFENYSENAMERMAQLHGLLNKEGNGLRDKDEMGLLWDRDTVAFYGDPAWDARYPRDELPWEQALTVKDGRYTFTVSAKADGNWPGRPLAMILPHKICDIKLMAGADLNPVITDTFILLPLSGAFKKGAQVQIIFEARTMARPDKTILAQCRQARRLIARLPEKDRPGVWRALFQAGTNRVQLLDLLADGNQRERTCSAFLLANMPEGDLKSLGRHYLAGNIQLALQARQKAPWAGTITDEMFLNDVLPYAVLSETREDWRKDFYGRFAEMAWACKSPGEAAVLLNREIFKVLGVKYHATLRPKPCQSPAESVQAKFASCTGLSILLVDACRAVGIPARIAGIPAWKTGGNHNWVEIWDGAWHHVGAGENTLLDQTWFSSKAREEIGNEWYNRVYATSFKRTGLFFPQVWDLPDHNVSAVDVFTAYKNP